MTDYDYHKAVSYNDIYGNVLVYKHKNEQTNLFLFFSPEDGRKILKLRVE